MVHHYLHPLRDFIITCIVTGSCYMIHLLRKSQQVLVENQQLRTENLVNQYEALKNQLNPHMLFNSLNTLRSLIRETPDKAQDYLQELSRVLRYTLQENESQSVTLRRMTNGWRLLISLCLTAFSISSWTDIGGSWRPPAASSIRISNEKAAVRNLTALLSEAAPHIGVVAVLDSIAESIDWFRANAMPDLIFLDIHLADGSAFEIFEHVDISCPII